NGQFILESGGYNYTFGATGALLSLVSATDDLHPAALQYGFSTTTPPVLQTITDPARGTSCAGQPCTVTLSYGGDPNAPAACSGAPAGLLCNIAFWDGTSTSLTYDGSGHLSRITDPGNVVY